MAARVASFFVLLLAKLVIAFPASGIAPLHIPEVSRHDLIDNQYIVVLKDETPADAFRLHVSHVDSASQASPLWGENGLRHVWEGGLIKGYSGRFSDDVLEMIRHRPEVDYVEQSHIVRVAGIQESAPWGLARISSRTKLEKGTDYEHYEYVYDGDEPGKGVMAYVIDTGILLSHVDFEGRAHWGTTVVKGAPDTDDHGHGTHVSGTIGGKHWGIAKNVTLTAVKVFDSSGRGTADDIIAGLDWADKNATALALQAAAEIKATGTSSHKGSVFNMSLGTGLNRALSQTVSRAIEHNHTVVSAAGNFNENACKYSPGNLTEVVTVGATTIDEWRWGQSNWGPCVDIFAPGQLITSCGTYTNSSKRTVSGTSMATPHVTGVIAYLISIYPHPAFNSKVAAQSALLDAYSIAYDLLPTFITRILPGPELFQNVESVTVAAALTPAQLKKALLSIAIPDLIKDTQSRNVFLFNNATGARVRSYFSENILV